ncbi:cupin domain-containing protein [Kitasatospora sp. NPDC058063]|uniref:cupin domain-containing protein n=1 Tax=unclassified Kitasatospora TaxID=2633591 RepID=UPI0036DD2520
MSFPFPVPDNSDPRWTREGGVHVRRGEGIARRLAGDTCTITATADDTNGALGFAKAVVPPGGGAIPHAHGREEEAFYVLSGDFDVVNGDEIVKAGPGDLLFVPRDDRHGFTNTGDLPGRLLTFIMPGGHEGFWLDNGIDPEPGKAAPPLTPEDLVALTAVLARHQVTIMLDRES